MECHDYKSIRDGKEFGGIICDTSQHMSQCSEENYEKPAIIAHCWAEVLSWYVQNEKQVCDHLDCSISETQFSIGLT